MLKDLNSPLYWVRMFLKLTYSTITNLQRQGLWWMLLFNFIAFGRHPHSERLTFISVFIQLSLEWWATVPLLYFCIQSRYLACYQLAWLMWNLPNRCYLNILCSESLNRYENCLDSKVSVPLSGPGHICPISWIQLFFHSLSASMETSTERTK